MSRTSFHAIYDLIKDHSVFAEKTNNGRGQASVKYQLMVLLKYLGTEGSRGSNLNLCSVFGIGEGTAELYRDRVVEALLSLQEATITWPDAAERKAIAERFDNHFGWPHCVGIIDGTLFPLAF